jgi:hypothetical protein
MNRSLRDLQRLSSELHKVVVIKASLPIVELAYKLNPSSLTDEVLTDAFQSGASQDVLRFLVKKKGLDQNQRSELIAKTCLNAIPVLQSGNHGEREEQLAQLNGLIQAFQMILPTVMGTIPFARSTLYFTRPVSLISYWKTWPTMYGKACPHFH